MTKKEFELKFKLVVDVYLKKYNPLFNPKKSISLLKKMLDNLNDTNVYISEQHHFYMINYNLSWAYFYLKEYNTALKHIDIAIAYSKIDDFLTIYFYTNKARLLDLLGDSEADIKKHWQEYEKRVSNFTD